jgi:16S rRNA (guanine527-N7)-methyltransferase
MHRDRGVKERVLRALAEGGVSGLSPEQMGRLGVLVGELALWSGRMHLMGKRDIRRTLERQVLDSFLLLEIAERCGVLACGGGGRVADVGSGSGFPGLVWKIARPALEVTLFERKEKQVLFLARMIALLGMKGIEAIGGDAARVGREGYYDIVVSKAAGKLSDLLPVAQALLAAHGAYVTIKGRTWESEARSAAEAGMVLEMSRDIPGGRGALIVYRKKPLN